MQAEPKHGSAPGKPHYLLDRPRETWIFIERFSRVGLEIVNVDNHRESTRPDISIRVTAVTVTAVTAISPAQNETASTSKDTSRHPTSSH